MALTIDNLEIQIQSDSKNATNGIEALTSSLEKLKSVVGDTSGLASNLTQISTALKTFSGLGKINLASPVKQLGKLNDLIPTLGGGQGTQLAQNLRDIADGLTALSSVPKISITPVANGIKTLSDTTKGLDTTRLEQFSSQMKSISEGLSNLSGIGKTNIGSVATALKKIPEITESLKPEVITEFSAKVKELTAIMTPLAEQMDKIARGFNALPNAIKRAIKASDQATAKNGKLKSSYSSLTTTLSKTAAKYMTLYFAATRVANIFAEWFNESNDYIESLNLFRVSMGEATDAAMEYANKVSDALGIDPSEWMQNQGVFMRMATGFGLASDKAELMSQNLTQLGYDLASFFNTDVDTAMKKLQSGMSGQIKGLKAWGYNLSVAALQETALSLGIEESVRSMTEAEKAQLRYITLIQKSNGIMGDMTKTIMSPANAMRVLDAQITQLKRALGNIVSVLITKFIPYIMAAVELMTEFAESIAEAWGFEIPEFPEVELELGSDAIEEAEEELATLKKQLMGFDELNILNSKDDDAGKNWLENFTLPEYDFLNGFEGIDLEPYKKKLKEILEIVRLIGTTFLAWKITTTLPKTILNIKELLRGIKETTSIPLELTIGFKVLGAAMFLADIKEFFEYFDDFKENGATFHNVAGMISEFVGVVGDALILLGNLKVGGALKVVQGIGEIVVAIEDIANNGVNWDNAFTAIRGLTNVAIGIGVFTKNIKLAAWSVTLQGFTTIIKELQENWDAIKEGDWSGVDKAALIIGGLEILGGLLVAFDAFAKFKKSVPDVSKAPEVVETVSTSTSTLNTKMTSLAKNLGLGIAIVAEVAAAAIIFVGAIWIIGEELKKIAEAWQPVVENAGTVAIAIGVGTVLLVGVGAACAALGPLGTPLIVNIALGTAILAELSVATLLFVAEIWLIGEGLTKINDAWQPVIDNGETIAVAIGVGTALLVGIGVATAALGVAAVVSVGALPIAIALGTAMLVELGAAFVAFVESLVVVSDALANDLAPSLENTNSKIPGLTENMVDFTDYLKGFAEEFTDYTKSMGKTTWSGIVNSFLGLFSNNPIETLADNVSDIGDDASDLIRELNETIPKLETAISLVGKFNQKMSNLGSLMEVKKSNSGLLSSIGAAFNNLFGRTSFSVSNTSTYGNIGMYASGGFPSMGEMFVARERGPELVGRIGNKNAVANNNQIVTGIASAVYSAMMAAQEDGNSNGGGTPARIIVQVREQAIGEASVRYINGRIVQTGESPIYS